MKRAMLTLASAAALVFFSSTAASAQQDEWVQQVRRQLQRAAETYRSQGYHMSHEVYTGSLNDDATESVTLTLDGGSQYQLMGACDNDCSDLDLVLYDAAGRQVDSDLLDDDFPVVSVSVARTGRYRVEVRMPVCSAEPCRYGIGVFAK